MVCRIVENFFRQQPQNSHVVLADRQTRMAGRDDFVDKCWPVVRPFLLEDRYKNKVELVQEGSLGFERLLRGRALDDKVHNKIANT